MKIPLSTMTAQQFVEATAALGLNYKAMGVALDRSAPTISGYATGRLAIPVMITERIGRLVNERVAKLTELGEAINTTNVIGSLIVQANEQRMRGNPEPHRTTGRFMRRQGNQDTRIYPAYRMTVERYRIYLEALASWRERVIELAHEHTDEPRQRDYALEMADLKAMAANAPRNAPYDVYIQRNEWEVVSRALRHLASTDPTKYRAAHALRVHWAKHKGAGYPRNRVQPTGVTSNETHT